MRGDHISVRVDEAAYALLAWDDARLEAIRLELDDFRYRFVVGQFQPSFVLGMPDGSDATSL